MQPVRQKTKATVLGAIGLAMIGTSCAGSALGLDAQPATNDQALHAKIDGLIAELGDADAKVRDRAKKELIRIGEPARQKLAEALDSDDPEIRRRARDILKELNATRLAQAEVHVVGVHEAYYFDMGGNDILDWPAFWGKVRDQAKSGKPNPGRRIWELLPEQAKAVAQDDELLRPLGNPYARGPRKSGDAAFLLIRALQAIQKNADFYQAEDFANTPLSDQTKALALRAKKLTPLEVHQLNRWLLEDAFPAEIANSPRGPNAIGNVQVRVTRSPKPTILVLTAYNSIRWHVHVDKDAPLVKVIVGGYHHQEVTGPKVPVEYHVYESLGADKRESRDYFFLYKLNDPEDREHDQRLTRLRAVIGRPMTSFQGQYHFDGRPFLVPPRSSKPVVPADAELHAVGLYGAGIGIQEISGLHQLAKDLHQASLRQEATPGKRIWELLDRSGKRIVMDPSRLAMLAEDPQDPEINLQHQLMRIPLQKLLQRNDLYEKTHFARVSLPPEGTDLANRYPHLSRLEMRQLNALLLSGAFPGHFKLASVKGFLPGTAVVRVKRTPKPIILALNGYQGVRWIVRQDPGARIAWVIACGYDEQEVVGSDAPVSHMTYYFGDRTEGQPEAFYCYRRESARYPEFARKLKELTGREIASFQGKFRFDGDEFVIGEAD